MESIKGINMLESKMIGIRFDCTGQCDGGTNTSIANSITILHHVLDIEDYEIGGIGRGVVWDKKEVYYLKYSDGEALPVDIFSIQAT